MRRKQKLTTVKKITLGKVCPRCHYIVPFHDRFCYHCGLNFVKHARCAAVDAGKNSFPTMKKTRKCPRCHRRISDTNRYCNYCGYDMLRSDE